MKQIVSKDDTLAAALLSQFKEHLRILHNDEDDLIQMYLDAAIDLISTYGDIDIKQTVYKFSYIQGEPYKTALYTHLPVGTITLIEVKDSLDVVVTDGYEYDYLGGYIYPQVATDLYVEATVGYATEDLIPSSIRSIVFRYGAHLHEHRESIMIGEPKDLPDWVNYALASIFRARV